MLGLLRLLPLEQISLHAPERVARQSTSSQPSESYVKLREAGQHALQAMGVEPGEAERGCAPKLAARWSVSTARAVGFAVGLHCLPLCET